MKINIDTKAKTFTVEGREKITDVVKELKELLGDSFKEYTMVPQHVVREYVYQPPLWPVITIDPPRPYPLITCGGGGGSGSYPTGNLTIEINK